MDAPESPPDTLDDPSLLGDDERVLRVFVSSTFRDMQRERDELVKRVFPQIRAMCARRGVQWSEIDLRWGVTDEQKAEGEVLPICLAEIERTRPYFIGMIGQRYGWVPDELPAPLVDRLDWLTEDLGRSVTELEILHGVLHDRDGVPDGHALFYLRDPAWLDTLEEGERLDHLEASDDGRRRLGELRDRIRSSGHPTSDYASPRHLGELVLADLTALVDRRFPASDAPDARRRAAQVHRTFGRTRFALHVERAVVVDELDRYAAGGEEGGEKGGEEGGEVDATTPLVVTGASGVGVSSLVTNWAWWSDRAVLVHHVEADADAADHRAMVARLIAELDHDGPSLEELLVELSAAPPPELRGALTRAFSAQVEPVVIVIDGADRLADVDRAPDLSWLPDHTPAAVRLVLTSTGARPVEAARRRSWPIVEVPVLAFEERIAVARTVLAASSKALDREHLEALVAGTFAGNARFLRAVLDELRQHGDHFTLRPLIDRLIAVGSVDDLLELVLARYEADFDRDRPGLTRDVMTAVWAARHGLAEHELLELLGGVDDDGDPLPLPQAVWAPLHLAVEQSLVSRGGLLGFADPDMVRAVEDRYLATQGDREAAHARLADFFAAQPMSDRVVDELGWQQADAGDLAGLARTVSDLEFVGLAARRQPHDVRRLWARLGMGPAETEERMREAYRDVVEDPAAFDTVPDDRVGDGDASRSQLGWSVAGLLADAGELPWAMRLRRHIVDTTRAASEAAPDDDAAASRLRSSLVNLGANQLRAGELHDADATLSEALESARRHGSEVHLVAITSNLGIVRRELGRTDEAAMLLAESAEVCRRRDDRYGLQAALGNIAQLHRQTGDHDAALDVLIEQERICRDLADPVAVARSLLGQAVALADRGDVAAGLDTMERSAGVCREEGDLVGLVEASINIAVTAGEAGQIDRGMAASRDGEAAARTLGDPMLLARTLTVRAMLLGWLGRWEESATIATEADLTARAASLPRQRAEASGALGTARRELGDLDASSTAHAEELAAATETGDRQLVANAEANIGNVAAARQQFDVALDHYGRAMTVFDELGLPSLLLPVAANRAQIHQMSNRMPDALADYALAAEAASQLGLDDAAAQWARPAMQIGYQLGDVAGVARLWTVMAQVARRTGDDAGLQKALGERAGLLISQAQAAAAGAGRPDELDDSALTEIETLLSEQHLVCTRIDDDVGLAACVGNLAVVARYRGDLDRALTSLDQQLEIARRSNNAQSALFATANRGEILGLLGRTDEALVELGAARVTAQQYGLAPMVQQLDQMIAALS